MSFKTASQLAQARARRPVGDYLPSYYENLSLEEKRDCLKQIFWKLEEEVKVETDAFRKRAIGQVKFEIQSMMHDLRPAKKAPGVEQYFIDAARETLTKALFDVVMTNAVKKMKEAQ